MADLNYLSPVAPHYSNTAILDGKSATLWFPKHHFHPLLLFKIKGLGTKGCRWHFFAAARQWEANLRP